jgi:hypothetical protein
MTLDHLVDVWLCRQAIEGEERAAEERERVLSSCDFVILAALGHYAF